MVANSSQSESQLEESFAWQLERDRLQARAKTKAANQDSSQLPSDLIKPYDLGVLEATIARDYGLAPRKNPFNWYSQPRWWQEYESGMESARVAQIEAALLD